MTSNYIVGLDIGSHSIRAAICEISKDGQASLVSLLKVPSSGVRKGVIDNVADATHSVSKAMEEIKKISRSATKNIILGVGDPDIKVQHSKGVVAVSRADDEIYEDDINRVKQSSQAINLPPNRTILHVINKEFVVDGISGIRDPLGMIGKRLELNTLLIDAFSPAIKNLQKCVETLGGKADEIVLSPLACSPAVLTKSQRELGVVLIDIGFSKTSLAVYEEDKLLHSAIIPVGSGNITNDLAIGLRIPIEAAETVKLSFGSAIAKEVSARDVIDLSKIDARASGTASKKFVAEIIEVRLAEIFELVNNEIKQIGKASQLPAGAVLVGGGAKIPNITELARSELKLAAQIGIPDISKISSPSGELNMQAEDPEFACVIGLLLYDDDLTQDRKSAPKPIMQWFKKILNYFIP